MNKASSLNKSWMRIVAVCGLGLVAGLVTFRAQADEWDKKTILTVDQPIQITDTYLEPGTYVLKLADSSSNRHIVYIFNEQQNHLINTVMAIPNYRLQPTGSSRFTFWETPAGSARAMRAWFYPGDNFGQEFTYPKNLRQIAVVTARSTVAPKAPEVTQTLSRKVEREGERGSKAKRWSRRTRRPSQRQDRVPRRWVGFSRAETFGLSGGSASGSAGMSGESVDATKGSDARRSRWSLWSN
jgi:hypothetical protein